MKESISLKSLFINLKSGELGFFDSKSEDGPGFLYKTLEGKVFGCVAHEITTKDMLEMEKRLG